MNPYLNQSENASTLNNRDHSVLPQQKQEQTIAYHSREQSGEFI